VFHGIVPAKCGSKLLSEFKTQGYPSRKHNSDGKVLVLLGLLHEYPTIHILITKHYLAHCECPTTCSRQKFATPLRLESYDRYP
jgi:hypothetical protein